MGKLIIYNYFKMYFLQYHLKLPISLNCKSNIMFSISHIFNFPKYLFEYELPVNM